MDFFTLESRNVYIYFAIIIVIILAYMAFLYTLYGIGEFLSKDFLNTLYINNTPAFGNVGGWSVSHFVAFFIAGFLFPSQWFLIFILGVAWEFLESLIGDILYENTKFPRVNTDGMYQTQWLDGNLSDIWFNSMGLFLGYWTSVFFYKQNIKL